MDLSAELRSKDGLGVPTLTLTIEEIKDLAEFAGLRVNDDDLDSDNRDTEITVTECPKQGVKDETKIVHCRHIAYLEEYPEEGVMPLGTPNDKVSA